MLRLHNADGDVILFGLIREITDYARFAYEGTHNEHTNLFGCYGVNARVTCVRVQQHTESFVRSRCAMRRAARVSSDTGWNT